jgi:hypothetical protein
MVVGPVGPFSTVVNICPMPNLGNGFTNSQSALYRNRQVKLGYPENGFVRQVSKAMRISYILEFSIPKCNCKMAFNVLITD